MEGEVNQAIAKRIEEDFLQSELWRAFQESAGRKSRTISGDGFFGNGFLSRVASFMTYLYFPHGPIIDRESVDTAVLVSEIKELASQEKLSFIRIEPKDEGEKRFWKELYGKRFAKAPQAVQPEETLVIDITPSEEELFARMKPKTRYNIRIAEKRGVRVFETREKKYKQAFLDLMEETAKRKDIRPHPRAYYKAFFSGFPEGACRLFVAELDGVVLAANLVLFIGSTATYLHGGSDDSRRDAMAPYLLQWEQIREAKRSGAARYDFGGVRTAARRKGNASWDGITRFKEGFSRGTEALLFPGTYDIILNAHRYYLYTTLRGLRRFFRSLGL